jgi:hypothetical protein
MADPTRPTAAWLAAQPRAAGTQPPVSEAAPPGVQIVVTGPSRKFAIVDGEPVHPGETHDGAKLLTIDEGGVMWQRGSSHESSSMNAGAEKTEPGRRVSPPQSPNIRKKMLIGESQ